jgi:2-methylisocitrate lyase-like PEP mutase family enzyme
MTTAEQRERASTLFELHQAGTLLLPNAWDAGSAVIVAAAGARAIATTSEGVAWSRGLPDGQVITRGEMVEAVRRIVDVVAIPVTADIEGGYGDDPDAVAATVEAVIAAGAVGVNIEDSKAVGGPLYSTDVQVARLRAARAAAERLGLRSFVINARTDTYLFAIGDTGDRLADTLDRAMAYAAAGADVLFVPGVADLELICRLVRASPIPINALAGPGWPAVTALIDAGVRRISWGSSIAAAAYSLLQHAAEQIFRGDEP